MSKSAMRILRAAADMVGGLPELAVRLGTHETFLAEYMVGYRPVPDPLLLKVLDIVLAERETRVPRTFFVDPRRGL